MGVPCTGVLDKSSKLLAISSSISLDDIGSELTSSCLALEVEMVRFRSKTDNCSFYRLSLNFAGANYPNFIDSLEQTVVRVLKNILYLLTQAKCTEHNEK